MFRSQIPVIDHPILYARYVGYRWICFFYGFGFGERIGKKRIRIAGMVQVVVDVIFPKARIDRIDTYDDEINVGWTFDTDGRSIEGDFKFV